jgi:hypothetical protein
MDHRELMIIGTTGSDIVTGGGIGGDDGNHRGLDPMQLHYCSAYSAAELKTFHCDRVRKMPLSGLDPSMLIGFLCRDEDDWRDFRKRVSEVRLFRSLSVVDLFLSYLDFSFLERYSLSKRSHRHGLRIPMTIWAWSLFLSQMTWI